MPDPPRNFQAFTASLEKSGFKVKAHPGQWRGGYVSGVNGGQAEVFLFGWTGDFGDPGQLPQRALRPVQLAVRIQQQRAVQAC